MGYYSDVALVLSPVAVKAFDKHIEEDNGIKSLLDIATTTKDKDGCRVYYWNGIKWYNSQRIDNLEEWLNTINEHEFIFHIIGEDLEDASTQGLFWDNPFDCRITRCIDFDE